MSARIGERWASKDKRDAGKVVEVVERIGLYGNRIRVVEFPGRADLIGRETLILDKTLRACYRLAPPEDGEVGAP